MLNCVCTLKNPVKMESLGRLVNLNVLLSLYTIQTAESEDLIDVRYLSITCAQIIDLPIKYVSVGENLDKHSSSWKTKQNWAEISMAVHFERSKFCNFEGSKGSYQLKQKTIIRRIKQNLKSLNRLFCYVCFSIKKVLYKQWNRKVWPI